LSIAARECKSLITLGINGFGFRALPFSTGNAKLLAVPVDFHYSCHEGADVFK
jgi:hypothetical protein